MVHCCTKYNNIMAQILQYLYAKIVQRKGDDHESFYKCGYRRRNGSHFLV